MDAIKAGIESHKKLEEIYKGAASVNAEAFDVIIPGIADETSFQRALANYHEALADLARILSGEPPKMKTAFEENLRNDGIYEYTSTGSCDGSETYNFRRKPAISANPSSWDSIENIPEGAKHHHD